MSANILVIGSDPALVRSRVLVLRARKYEVTWGLEIDADSLLKSASYNLLLVCSSVPSPNGSDLIVKAHRQAPEMRVIRLMTLDALPTVTTQQIAAETVRVDYHPMTWVSAVDRLLAPESGSKAQSEPSIYY